MCVNESWARIVAVVVLPIWLGFRYVKVFFLFLGFLTDVYTRDTYST